MRHSRSLAIVLVAFALLVPSVAAQRAGEPVMRPAEVMVLDPGGFQLLGYGTLEGRVLRLELVDRVGDFVLLLVGSSGGLEQLRGTEDADGALRLVFSPEAGEETLEAFFAARDLELVVVRSGSVTIGEQPAPPRAPTVPGGDEDDDRTDDDLDDDPGDDRDDDFDDGPSDDDGDDDTGAGGTDDADDGDDEDDSTDDSDDADDGDGGDDDADDDDDDDADDDDASDADDDDD